jgi:ppGpp synthetase/RelA/SpoT-type nucleotidyltranferase
MADGAAQSGRLETEEWARAQVRTYAERRADYKVLATTLAKVLEYVAAKYDPMAIVQARAKGVPSFAGKILRKDKQTPDPVNEFTDLCGARIIVHTESDVQNVAGFLEDHFDVDWVNTNQANRRLGPTEFGYRSTHYIVSFRPSRGGAPVFPSAEVPVEIPGCVFAMANPRAEIQVRTIVQHAWADVNHDLAYKSTYDLPATWQRRFARAAAILEEADSAFSSIVEGLRVYSTSYGSYMTANELTDEISRLEFVLEQDPGDLQVCSRIGSLALALGDWDKSIHILATQVDDATPDANDPLILRDLGVALCEEYLDAPTSAEYRRGQQYLSWSADMDPTCATLCRLAHTYTRSDVDKAAELYLRARTLDPADPEALQLHLECDIRMRRDRMIMAAAGPSFAAALARCRARADVGVDLVQTYLQIGALSLLSGAPEEALAAYAKAATLSEAPFPIDGALQSLDHTESVAQSIAGHEWARRFLLLVLAAKFPQAMRLADIQALASDDRPIFSRPVFILAGGCDGSELEVVDFCRPVLTTAFARVSGTIVSGGTLQGIPGLAGDVRASHPSPGQLALLGYVPRYVPADATVDRDPSRYSRIIVTGGSDFTPLEVLQSWIDAMAAGIRPEDVRLLGIGGGRISALEYRIALALGATVGIVEGSGREADRILSDDDWRTSERLIRLPLDPWTIRYFVGPEPTVMPAELCEVLAPAIHETYRQSQLHKVQPDDPALKAWDDLSDDFRSSSYQQAESYARKLEAIDCVLVKVEGRAPTILSFTDSEIETLAEMEHGRWNMERLAGGWRLADRKDVAARLSPCLIGWAPLPESEKDKDRMFARSIPADLAPLGFEVQRRARPT